MRMKVSTFKGRTSEICEDKTGTRCIGKAHVSASCRVRSPPGDRRTLRTRASLGGGQGHKGSRSPATLSSWSSEGLLNVLFMCHEQNLGAAEDSLWERCRCHPVCTGTSWVGDLRSAAGRGVTGGGAAGQGGTGGLEASGRLRGGGSSHDGPADGGLPGAVHAHRGLAAHGHMSARLAGAGRAAGSLAALEHPVWHMLTWGWLAWGGGQ